MDADNWQFILLTFVFVGVVVGLGALVAWLILRWIRGMANRT